MIICIRTTAYRAKLVSILAFLFNPRERYEIFIFLLSYTQLREKSSSISSISPSFITFKKKMRA